MKPHTHILMVILLGLSCSLSAQDIQGKKVTVRLNNIPKIEAPVAVDQSKPGITIVSPPLDKSNQYLSEIDHVDLIGKVSDESRIALLSVDSDIIEFNSAGVFTTSLQLTPGHNVIRLVAMDEHDNLTEKYVNITYSPPPPSLADKISESSLYYGLIIGIDKYRDPMLQDLDNPVRDCQKLKNTLTENYTFKEENIILLENATRRELIQSLDELTQKITPDDNLLIYYAGHGWWDESSENGYWLPSDAEHDEKTNWVRNSAIVDYLKEIHSKHTLLIADACFGGSIFKSRSVNLKQDKAFERLYELPSRKAMTSGTLTEVPDRSSFTKFLIDRLLENDTQYLSSEQLFSSFRIAVINNSDAIPQFGDISNVGDQGGDFIFLSKE